MIPFMGVPSHTSCRPRLVRGVGNPEEAEQETLHGLFATTRTKYRGQPRVEPPEDREQPEVPGKPELPGSTELPIGRPGAFVTLPVSAGRNLPWVAAVTDQGHW